MKRGLFVLVLVGLLFFVSVGSASAATYYRTISISPSTPFNDYQVNVVLNSTNFNYNYLKTDGGDIRFTDSNGNNLNYFVESWNNGGTSNIWVKVPTAGTSSITMTYGDSSLNSLSDASSTFYFYDNFSNGLDSNKWKIIDCGTTTSVVNGELQSMMGSGWVGANNLANKTLNLTKEGYVVTYDTRMPQETYYGQGNTFWVIDPSAGFYGCGGESSPYNSPLFGAYLVQIGQSSTNCRLAVTLYPAGTNNITYKSDIISGNCPTLSTYAPPQKAKTTLTAAPSGSMYYSSNSQGLSSFYPDFYFSASAGSGYTAYIDNVMIRKYSENGPVASVGVQQSTCPIDQVILKLYRPANSHAAIWSDTVYNYSVCYSTIFGQTYGGNSPHACTGINNVLSLYRNTNAHVAVNSSSGYATSVCYGTLNCTAKSSQSDCAAWGTNAHIIASLYQKNNSHISMGDDSNYPIKICCKPEPVEGGYWQDMNSVRIQSSPIGVNVKMYVSGSSEGVINFAIEMFNASGWNYMGQKSITVSAGPNSTSWPVDIAGVYRFKADVPGVGQITSNNLTVSGTRTKTRPVLTLVRPGCGSDFKIGDIITFTVNVNDPYDIINGIISFGDGTSQIISNGDNNFNHSYSSSGTMKVLISANDSVDNYQVSRTSNMISIDPASDAKYIAGCINTPDSFQTIKGNDVNFDAGTTRAFSYNHTNDSKTNYNLRTDVRFYWNFTDFDTSTTSCNFYAGKYNCTNSQYPALDKLNQDGYGISFTKSFPLPGQNGASLFVELMK